MLRSALEQLVTAQSEDLNHDEEELIDERNLDYSDDGLNEYMEPDHSNTYNQRPDLGDQYRPRPLEGERRLTNPIEHEEGEQGPTGPVEHNNTNAARQRQLFSEGVAEERQRANVNRAIEEFERNNVHFNGQGPVTPNQNGWDDQNDTE